MSSRALRRLVKEQEKNRDLAQNDVVETEAHEYQPVKKSNLFALMGDEEGEDEAEEDNDDDDDDEQDLEVEKPQIVHAPARSKKSKKKKKKAKQEPRPTSDDELDQFLAELSAKENKPIDTTISEDQDELEINVTHPEIDPSFRYFTPSKQLRSVNLLKVDVKDLDPDNEFKKLFGKLSHEAIQDAESTTSTSIPPEQLQQIRKLSKVIRGWGGKDRRSIPGTTRKLILTKIRDDWIPTQTKEMSMEELTVKELVHNKLLESEDWEDVIKEDVNQLLSKGIKFFKFTRVDSKVPNSQFYNSVVVTPNHESLMTLLSRYPYHAETILQVALIFIRQGDKSNSNGLVERALFAFDRAFRQNFELFNGLTRLPYSYYLNRQFYLALFRYIEVLTKKGTYATALTYSKVLLSLCPDDDPLGVRYFIDFYAILSQDYRYLIQFVESPLVKTYSKWFTPGLAYSTVLAHLRLDKGEDAKAALRLAFLKHPFMGYKLLEAIGLADDIPVKDYSVFEVGQETELSTEAYLLRAPILWNDSKDRKFLHDSLLELLNSEKELKFEPAKDGVIPVNFLRFAILSGEGKIMSKIPAEVWDQNEIYEYDVLPPKSANVDVLEDSIDHGAMQQEYDDERMMEMVRNMSLQEVIDQAL